MATPTVPLEEVAQRIAQQQTELKTLRREYEKRQRELAQLARRKQALQAELSRVDGEIDAVTRGQAPAAARAKPAPATKKTQAPPSLPQLLVDLVRQAGGRATVKQLVAELERRHYPTKNRNLSEVVKSRVHDLVKNGLLHRAKDHAGVELPTAKAPKAAPARPATVPVKPAGKKKQSLADLLTVLLQKATRPLTGSELAQQAAKAGYRSKSGDFANVVWVTLGKMTNVDRIKGQGYRLKKK